MHTNSANTLCPVHRYNETSVRIPAFPLFLLLSPLALSAQDRPQFIWQGDVDGIAILRLRADHLTLQVEGSPVSRQQFQFYNSLPDVREDARLEVREGRGYVHILDQPRLENNYTLAVSIEDRQPGGAFYSIALYWDTSDRAFERRSGRAGKLAWNGRVDQEALIACHDKTCAAASAHGAPVSDSHFKFSRPLPHRDVEVSIEDPEGRGEIRLVEQPRETNRFTAKVSIRDPQSGSSEYSFALVWREPGGKAPLPVILPDRGLVWSGTVNGRVRVSVQGRSALSQMLEGGSVTGERAEFFKTLPASSDLKPAIKRLEGAAAAEIVETPSEKNNYRLVFEIKDTGSAPSTFEIDW